MAPLKSLEKEYPLIDSNFQSFCASHAIFSVQDFLLHDIDALIALADNHCASQTLKQGIDQLLSIIDARHPPLLNGLQLLEDVQRNKHVLSTGCEGIDALLGGGLREGQLTELVGSSASGKTQACLLSASTVAKHKSSVIYLDTGNSFSPHRIARFVGQSSGYDSENQADHMLKKVLDRIICHSVFDIYQMLDVLHQLKINLRSEIVKSNQHVRLLIVDSISSLITPILGGSNPQGHALMISAGYLLKKLAHEHNIAVLVTNHVVRGEDGISKPALGESWKSVPHVRLLFSQDCGSNVCNISMLKHPSMVCHSIRKFLYSVICVS
ncbi:DNA repair protein RAD51 homolog 4 isoform X1 [Vigna angularis]|uniref:DNA repair protein RAD51 homolog 4 isoform X1 n=1 Tax=Phaseolus angularis TaxID=3914 RepID=UPI000809EBB9|nr:DNA repair protein RAD51 homolog 4 isoform X1 [Vigna angularis]